MRGRDPGVGERADGGGHARHHLERDAGGAQRLRLLGATPEDERVAVLEPHDDLPRACPLDEELLDVCLREALACAVRTSDRDHLGLRPHRLEDAAVDQVVVHHDVGGREPALPAEREQARIAGTGTHQHDAPAHRPRTLAAPRSRSRRARSRPSASASARAARSSSSNHSRPSGSLTCVRSVTWPSSSRACAASGVLQSPADGDEEGALGGHGDRRVRIVHCREQRARGLVGLPALQRERALPHRREQFARIQRRRPRAVDAEALRAPPRRAPARRPRRHATWPAACRRCRAGPPPPGRGAAPAAGHARRTLLVPTRAPRARPASPPPGAPTSTSRASARAGHGAHASPGANAAGTSFRECTAQSIRPVGKRLLQLLDEEALATDRRQRP